MGVFQDEGMGKGMELGLWMVMGMEVEMAVPLPWDVGTSVWEGTSLRLLEASPEQGWFLVSHFENSSRYKHGPAPQGWFLGPRCCLLLKCVNPCP